MKTKTIELKIKIPVSYKWMAINSFGEILIFKRKPEIVKSEYSDLGEYWGCQDDEISILSENLLVFNQNKDWKDSLTKI